MGAVIVTNIQQNTCINPVLDAQTFTYWAQHAHCSVVLWVLGGIFIIGIVGFIVGVALDLFSDCGGVGYFLLAGAVLGGIFGGYYAVSANQEWATMAQLGYTNVSPGQLLDLQKQIQSC